MANFLKCLVFVVTLSSIVSCKKERDGKTVQANNALFVHEQLYSKTVADTFSIAISLPEGYDPNGKEKYPVVYLLDANLYFDIAATSYKKYAEIGLTKPVILVGIGYKGLAEMDSLRSRDYTYPKALPEYEMAVSGGANRFLSFLDTELLPHIDQNYKTDTNKRILMGHSLGGYCTAYALLQQLKNINTVFTGFIAASPSLHYNNYYLFSELKKLQQAEHGPVLKAYFTHGGLEDNEDDNEPGLLKSNEEAALLNTYLGDQENVAFKLDTYSGLGHMDTPVPTFIKGLQWCLGD